MVEDVAADAVLLPAAAVSPARAVLAATSESAGAEAAAPQARLRAGLIWVLIFLTFGASMAVVAPIAFSLSVKLDILVPGRVDVLGLVTGVGAIASVIATPLVGVLSDRTRTRLGRRRPWAIGGGIAGLIGLYALAVAPSVPILLVGWIVTLVGWQTASGMVIAFMGDRLPEEQRGRVSAYIGFANMVAPIFGIGLVSSVASQLVLLFLIPGIIAVAGVIVFVIFAREVPDLAPPKTTSIGQIVSNMVFNPRKAPSYAWNWLGRALLFFGLSFTTTYGTYFIASRLDLPVSGVGGIVAILGVGGIVTGAIGALGVGFLSDRLKRRKIFVVLAGVIMLAGTVLSAVSYELPGLIGGALLATMAIGAFSTVDQAIVLDVLPDREESGRYLGIMQLAQQLPNTVGPLAAAGILVIGAGSSPNYTLMYVLSGSLALLGALVILFKVRGVR
ncbi:MFS transporter [Microbacteriaceae bacterium VKM Ac-2855]|nr:MFS transporter [Microbacteriaceae bacterium VKM Ac-2855]